MAGIHCCYRRLLILNTSRLIDKNAVLFQQTRKRHHLVFQMSALQNRVACHKVKLTFNANKLILYRLASTNVTDTKELVSSSKLKVAEVKNDSAQLINEPEKLNKEPDTVGDVVIDESSLPPIPTDVPELEFISAGLKEPTLQSLGLGSWWPSGIIQNTLQFLHINFDLPWWESILIITIVLRIVAFPLAVKTRKDSVNMMNHMPYVQEIQRKISEAKLSGDHYQVALHAQEFQKYMKDKNLNLFGSFKAMLVQGPIFLSMYYGLRGMSNAPVESFKTGGLQWFTDLTQPDPYYILPVMLSASLLAVIETGSEGNPVGANSKITKNIFRALPVCVLFFSLSFPSCITWYWTVSNLISLCQAGILRIPAVKKKLNIPELERNLIESAKKKSKKGFLAEFKEGYQNAKLTSELQDRERMNLVAFQKAGTGPIPRTFKTNPLEKAKKS